MKRASFGFRVSCWQLAKASSKEFYLNKCKEYW